MQGERLTVQRNADGELELVRHDGLLKGRVTIPLDRAADVQEAITAALNHGGAHTVALPDPFDS